MFLLMPATHGHKCGEGLLGRRGRSRKLIQSGAVGGGVDVDAEQTSLVSSGTMFFLCRITRLKVIARHRLDKRISPGEVHDSSSLPDEA